MTSKARAHKISAATLLKKETIENLVVYVGVYYDSNTESKISFTPPRTEVDLAEEDLKKQDFPIGALPVKINPTALIYFGDWAADKWK